MIRDLAAEVFDGCDHRWTLGLGEYELPGENVPWLRGALKERGIRLHNRGKRDLIEVLLEWERLRCAQVMLWGNPRYCQVADVHPPHEHLSRQYKDGTELRHLYWCDGRKVDELAV